MRVASFGAAYVSSSSVESATAAITSVGSAYSESELSLGASWEAGCGGSESELSLW